MEPIEKVIEKAELLLQDRNKINKLLLFLSDKKLSHFGDAWLYKIKGSAILKQRGSFIKNAKEALPFFSKAIELMPNNAELYRIRAGTYRRSRNFDKAMEDCQYAIQLEPKNAASYLERANVWRAMHKYNDMKKDLEKAVRVNPRDTKAYYLRSDFWKLYSRFIPNSKDNQFIDLEKAVKGDTKAKAGSYLKLGRYYLRKEQFDKTFDYYNKAINKDPAIDNWEMDMFVYIYSALSVVKKERAKIYEVCAPAYELLDSIKWMYLSNYDSFENSIVHFTKLSVADILFSSDNNKMRFFHASYMNDPEEGKVLVQIFDEPAITNSFNAAELNLESNFYIGSFLPETHADELVMWRTYGKDEHDSEAKGCSIVIDRAFFKKEKVKSKDSNTDSVKEEEEKKLNDKKKQSRSRFDPALYKVVYYNRISKTIIIPNEPDESNSLKKELMQLKSLLLKIIALKKVTDSKADKFNYAIDKIVHYIITQLRYYFKSADYSYENEERVILTIPPENTLVKIEDRNILPKRLYVESQNPLRKHIKTIILGPRVSHPEQWSYLKAKMIKDNFKIDVKKSVCKFQ